MTDNRVPVALTIAGTDPSGGAGIQADLRAFRACGVPGASVITAALAQNSRGVRAIHAMPPRFVARQIDAVAEDMDVASTKVGMLSDARVVSVVAGRIARRNLRNVVLDPVLAAKDGTPLLSGRGVRRLIEELLPRTLILTPNIEEARILSGVEIGDLDGGREAARALGALGPRYVVVKGGHWGDDVPPTDVLWDGVDWTLLEGERAPGLPVRGTGCLFSAALAAYLARGQDVPAAARNAKTFIGCAIRDAAKVGKGHPVWTDLAPTP